MTTTITIDREVIACLVDWITGSVDLEWWLDPGHAYETQAPENLETFELAQRVGQILDTRSWEGQA